MNLQQIEAEAERVICEQSFYRYLNFAWPLMEGGQQMDDNWHLRFVCSRLQKEVERIRRNEPRKKHLIINIPPRSGKSNIASAIVSWAWTQSPWMQFNSTSFADNLAKEHILKSRNAIQNDWYQGHWGANYQLSKDQNNLHTFGNTKGGKRHCSTIGSNIFGKGANMFIIDDATDPNKAESETERQNAIDFFTKTAVTRLNNPAVDMFIVIAQRLHDNDLVGYLLKNFPDDWEVICIPAELTEDLKPASLSRYYIDGLFFPKRFPPSVIADYRKIMGTRTYTAQMLQRTSPEGGGIIKSAWFGSFRMEELPPDVTWNFYIDTAYTKDYLDNDPSGLLTYCTHEGRIYISNFSEVWKEFPGFKKYLVEYVLSNGYTSRSRIVVERKASGISLIQEMRTVSINEEKHKLNIYGEDITDSKIQRAVNQTAKMEAGMVLLLEGGHWVKGFTDYLEAFPYGVHDEAVDTLTGAMRQAFRVKRF